MVGQPKSILRKQRQQRVRQTVRGSGARPRLSVFRSAKHIYVQVVSDEANRTLAAASTLSAEIKDAVKKSGNVEAAKAVGALIARRCLEQSIKSVVFDRNGFLYHGRVKALADAAREGGLQF
ncbi:MAG: 50S ribosomal protein L18 [Candidatus Binatia bacterium]